ncbi:Ubiquitin-like domain-containing CTD phosphatase 1 [Sciurus carolinensis]|uniref:Ubiquitin-like domain-containing CTD phosphatase 1 n=1 Tax=Sciurus carolinensis TaxID=30640 RepID=A0AA41TCP3_SCICA|nr:Ubiquitin-like domain-containing CTD phosphatase 1 [Sciurus carolinensis]
MALPIIVKWGGQEYSVTTLSEDDTVLDLKQFLKTLTGVLPERQKLLGLKVKGKPAENDVKLGALKLKPNTKIMMMGTREESLEDVLGPPPDNDDVVNDFDIEDEVVEVENREENLLKISRRVKEYKVEILNPPREGKKLLVLDVDYTLFDHRSCAETGVELMRPYLHEFLTSAYEDYDIVIWSATNMKWIEAKMKELGVSTNANYKITFMLDSAAMITVHTPRRGLIDVKPLGVIWGKFSEFYSKKNTIMFDDIGRNFLMNPQNGLKIRPFMKAHLNRDKDKELLKLTQYLKEIAKLDDFLELNHKYWESWRQFYIGNAGSGSPRLTGTLGLLVLAVKRHPRGVIQAWRAASTSPWPLEETLEGKGCVSRRPRSLSDWNGSEQENRTSQPPLGGDEGCQEPQAFSPRLTAKFSPPPDYL